MCPVPARPAQNEWAYLESPRETLRWIPWSKGCSLNPFLGAWNPFRDPWLLGLPEAWVHGGPSPSSWLAFLPASSSALTPLYHQDLTGPTDLIYFPPKVPVYQSQNLGKTCNT